MIVVDTNLIAYLHISGDRSKQAEQAFRKDPHWAAPRLWRSEMRNVLALHVRNRHLKVEQAITIMEAATNLMAGEEYDPASSQVLELAARSTCSAYDCEFVALAQSLNLPLVTVDKRILRQFPGTAIGFDEFLAQ
jgi:predicted nucleic acid-binding protein